MIGNWSLIQTFHKSWLLYRWTLSLCRIISEEDLTRIIELVAHHHLIYSLCSSRAFTGQTPIPWLWVMVSSKEVSSALLACYCWIFCQIIFFNVCLTQMGPFWLKMLTKRITFFPSTVWIYKIVTHMPFFNYPGSEVQRLFLAGPMLEFLSFCNQPKPLVFCWSWSVGTVFGLDSCNQGLSYSDHFPPYWPIVFCCW